MILNLFSYIRIASLSPSKYRPTHLFFLPDFIPHCSLYALELGTHVLAGSDWRYSFAEFRRFGRICHKSMANGIFALRVAGFSELYGVTISILRSVSAYMGLQQLTA